MTAPHQSLSFLLESAPFDTLEPCHIETLLSYAQVVYVTANTCALVSAPKQPCLYLIQSGDFHIQYADGSNEILGQGDYFGYQQLLSESKNSWKIDVKTAGLIYLLPIQRVLDIAKTHPAITTFFKHYHRQDLHSPELTEANRLWLYQKLPSDKTPIQADVGISIKEAAKIMSEQQVSSLLITQDGQLCGIITDRDLRNRVVAIGTDINLPVADVMSPNPVSIFHDRTYFDAVCSMTEHNVHHLPVVHAEHKQPVGMLTATDVVRQQRSNVLFVIGKLSKAKNLYELSRLAWQLPDYFAHHAKRIGDFDIAGKALSQATDLMTRRLIGFFEQQHGSAPLNYCWLVYGSQAREDQTMGSDQDNALLLEMDPDESQAEYFRNMGEYVCKGLSKCGIKLCNGNIMASNPQLRLSVDEALRRAQAWVAEPTRDAIMHFNIFLDVRAVAGDKQLLANLQQARAPLFQQSQFLGALAREVNEASVPLSVFQRFVYSRDAEHAIDLKAHGVNIINSLARLYALSAGMTVPNTPDRLELMPEEVGLNRKDALNLRDIWLFFNRLRWRQQVTSGKRDNLVDINQLSSLEKHQLKVAFKTIRRSQQVVLMKFAGGMAR